MTLSEALELEAGPELDAVVAEKVMGWKNPIEVGQGRSLRSVTTWFTVYRTAPGKSKFSLGWLEGVHWTRDGVRVHLGKPFPCWRVPDYSENVNRAWEVIERMHLKDFALDLRYRQKESGEWEWIARFQLQGMFLASHSESLAICKAALLAAWKE